MDQRVTIEEYDPERFGQEAAAIQAVIGVWVTGGIHHVGSTAVPGLAAKPITVKRDLAGRFPDDREAYTEGKAELIRRLL